MHFLAQPAEEPRELAAGNLLVERRYIPAQLLEELSRDGSAERVRREVTKGAYCPVDILQAAFLLPCGPDVEACLHELRQASGSSRTASAPASSCFSRS